jgi:hypothetical protein
MAARQQSRMTGWSALTAVVVMVVFLLVIFALPVPVAEQSLEIERRQLVTNGLGTEGMDSWIASQAADWTKLTIAMLNRNAGDGRGSQLAAYWAERLYVFALWFTMISYRAAALLMWSLIAVSILSCMIVEGFYIREIRKTTFSSQSPIKHKAGLMLFKWVGWAALVWIFLPFPMPFLLVPAAIVMVGLGMRTWVANLQKRI